MENFTKKQNNIELRSEKVRKLIGDIPNSLVHLGFAITVIIFVLLLSAACLLTYPYSNGESIIQHLLELI